MWIKLLTGKTIMGKRYQAGDWVDVGTGDAVKWIAAEHAESLNFDGLFTATDSGVVHPPDTKRPALPFNQIATKDAEPFPYFQRTMLMNASYSLMDRDAPDLVKNAGRFAIFFDLLESWDVVLILSSFETNASKVAQAEHDITRELCLDLRVPYYQRCIIGVKDSPDGKLFCEALNEEMGRGKVLAPMRAFWRVKPIAYFLPVGFGKKEAV